MYSLQRRHLQLWGFQFLILFLNDFRLSDILISRGIMFQMTGPLYLLSSCFRKYQMFWNIFITVSELICMTITNENITGWGHSLCLTWYIEIYSFCRFLSWIVTLVSTEKPQGLSLFAKNKSDRFIISLCCVHLSPYFRCYYIGSDVTDVRKGT